ncbi:Steryl-sulfatase [Merluccius polli]|uniref:Steryl-sulfatase n=1 Tax=Merluccius polli TaxID=89951 RepID=A0AA47PBR9_MERPO|nr:Steryl-sulfatase [Merluccius polli]
MLGSDDVTGSHVDTRPNFVLIMADDLGIGDVGCYGNNTIRTPNIDRLAQEGVTLSQHIAAAPLCTPSRAAFMTGRYALRSGLGSHGRVQVLLFLAGSGGLPPTETTFAKRLQKQGYTTGLVGKWHLGVNCASRGDHCHHPNHHGFHYFYGLPFTLFNNCVPGEGNDVLADVELALQHLSLLLGLSLLTLVQNGPIEDEWTAYAPEPICSVGSIEEREEVHTDEQNEQDNFPEQSTQPVERGGAILTVEAPQISPSYQNLNQTQTAISYTVLDWCAKRACDFVTGGAETVRKQTYRCYLHSLALQHSTSMEKPCIPISLLKLPVDLKGAYKGLGNKLEGQHSNAAVIIIDEVSMVSKRIFEYVWLRVFGVLSASVRLLAMLACVTVAAVAVWFVPFGFLQTWNCIVMRDQEVVEQPMVTETLTQRMLKEAQNFISRNADQPFLLFLSLAHVHTPLFHSPAFAGKSRHGVYGDNVEEMDWIVGQVTQTVDSLGLANNTMMYFTSDHGGHIEDPIRGGWNGIYKGGKAMGGWEGGIRVPGIFRWPGRLPAGRVVDEPTSLMDLYPTLKHLAQDTQTDRPLDGYNLMPLLEGSSDRSQHQFMFHYCGVYLNAVRWHPPGSDSIFKVHYFTPNFSPPGTGGCHEKHICQCHGDHVTHHDPPLVYDLFHDPSESRPLTPADEPRFAEVLERAGEAAAGHRGALTEAREPSSAPGDEPGVPSQMSWEKILWRPWLQPCCGTFPFCGCQENATLAT